MNAEALLPPDMWQVPLAAQLHCTDWAHECLHDALLAAGVKMYEAEGYM